MTETIYKGEDFTAEDMLGRHITDLVNDSVARNKDRTAFSCVLPSGHVGNINFDDLGFYSDAVAAYLREDLGLKPGDVVGIQCPNTLAYPVVAFGILKAGLIVTNINPLYTPDETNHQLKDSRAKALFVIDVFGDRIAESINGTDVKKVFKLTVVDLFSAFQRRFLHFIMRRVKKMVPDCTVPVDGYFHDVLKAGVRHLKRGVNVASYLAGATMEDIAFYQYTGGTTGRSKGAEITHANVMSNISQGHKRNKVRLKDGEDTMLLVLPLYHVYALAVGALAGMYTGTHIVLPPSPRPVSNLKAAFDKFDITIMPGVNTLYLALMEEDWFVSNPPKSMKLCYSGAAPLQPNTAKKWTEITGATIYQGYGLTESTCVVSSMPLTEVPREGSCGKPVPGTEVRIVKSDGQDAGYNEPGELLVRGPQIMKGYLNRAEATAETIEDGWLKTGDVAVIDEDGYIYIVDRIKDMVIVSGFNVYPTDIESILTKRDDVLDAAVVGVPCKDTGEKLIAYIIPEHDGVTKEDMVNHCREHLTGYKVPKVIEFVKEMPKSPVGKVLRKDLREEAIQKYGE